MRGVNSSCVDLVYLNPPLNSGRAYQAGRTTRARGASYDDIWTKDRIESNWVDDIELRCPEGLQLINSSRGGHSEEVAYYLTFMCIRLMELKRVLRSTGSIYLHCNPDVSPYLRAMMDVVFGKENFKSEVIWNKNRTRAGSKRWGPTHDTLLFYTGSATHCWNRVSQEPPAEYWSRYYTYEDEDQGQRELRGRFRTVSLLADGVKGELSSEWRGVYPGGVGRHWAVPHWSLRKAYPDMDEMGQLSVQRKLDLLDEKGLIYWPEGAMWPRHKEYADHQRGAAIQDVISDLGPIETTELTGWPGQVPEKLLDLIIRVSSDPGDLVLDPFCGSGTTCISAEKFGRKWIGIEKDPESKRVLSLRLRREFRDRPGRVTLDREMDFRTDPPERTDAAGNLIGSDQFTTRQLLYDRQEGKCSGCEQFAPERFFVVDRIDWSSERDIDSLDSLQLLCQACKAIKGRGSMTELKLQLYIDRTLPR